MGRKAECLDASRAYILFCLLRCLLTAVCDQFDDDLLKAQQAAYAVEGVDENVR